MSDNTMYERSLKRAKFINDAFSLLGCEWKLDLRTLQQHKNAGFVFMHYKGIGQHVQVRISVASEKCTATFIIGSKYPDLKSIRSIGFAWNKSKEVIARDIQKRLIFDVDDQYSKHLNKFNSEQDKKALLKIRSDAFCHFAGLSKNTYDYGYSRGSMYTNHLFSNRHGSDKQITVGLSDKQNNVNVFLGNLDEKTAFKVLALAKGDQNV